MNDGKKILAVILGAIFGFGAVAAITRNFSKEEEPEKEIEQETPGDIEQEVPSNPNLDLFPLLATNIVTTDIDESEIVAYVEFPEDYIRDYTDHSSMELMDNMVCQNVSVSFSYMSGKTAYTPAFNVYPVITSSPGFEGFDTKNKFCLSMDGPNGDKPYETYYIPITADTLNYLKDAYKFETNTEMEWTDGVYFSLSTQFCQIVLGSPCFNGNPSYECGNYCLGSGVSLEEPEKFNIIKA